MAALALSLLLTGLLLALPILSWRAYKTRPHQQAKALPRLLTGCTIAAWAGQTLRYALLAAAQNPIEARHALQLSTPLGWLVWLAALFGLALYIIMRVKQRRA